MGSTLMEHLDAHDGGLTENPVNASLEGPDREGTDMDRALARAIRQLIAESAVVAESASS
jgi:hypothetical protein